MGLLDHLWDDTVAGPPPDTGLGKLRKSTSSSSSAAASAAATAVRNGVQVTRSITILRTPSSPTSSAASSPRTPSCVPESPIGSLTPRGEWSRFRRKAVAVAEGMETAERRNPNAYDWVVISSLDR